MTRYLPATVRLADAGSNVSRTWPSRPSHVSEAVRDALDDVARNRCVRTGVASDAVNDAELVWVWTT